MFLAFSSFLVASGITWFVATWLQSTTTWSTSYLYVLSIRTPVGTSLVVQWLRLLAPNAGGPGSTPGQGTSSHMPQLRALMLQLRPVAAKKKFFWRTAIIGLGAHPESSISWDLLTNYIWQDPVFELNHILSFQEVWVLGTHPSAHSIQRGISCLWPSLIYSIIYVIMN